MSQKTVLIVDDEPDIRELLDITLSRMGLATHCAANLQQALQYLQDGGIDLCLTDMKLPDGNGITLVEHIQEHHSQIPVAMITAHGSVETAITALKAGAFDFISKPIELKGLRNLVRTALKLHSGDTVKLSQQTALIGQTPLIEELRLRIAKLARSQAPVYISGESGVGKEVVARLVHSNGPRSNGPFIAVNCGAIPAELMESELFGHVKGSFTGANEDKQGLFQAASGGSLFLDEVADLPLAMQVKLLRAIQEKAVRPVGGSAELATDVRILSASHKNLSAEVDAGHFRNDLYYRINVIEVAVPSLRQRAADIPLLAEFFIESIAASHGSAVPTLGRAALDTLMDYAFPGNVRELQNILERAMTLCSTGCIEPDDLQLPSSTPTPQRRTADHNPGWYLEDAYGDVEAFLENIEREVLSHALEDSRWNKTAAAKLLGISFRSLRYRLKKLDLDQ